MLHFFINCDSRASLVVREALLGKLSEEHHGFLKRIDWAPCH